VGGFHHHVAGLKLRSESFRGVRSLAEKHRVRNFVSTALKARNATSHLSIPLKDNEALRYLDAIDQVLRAIKAPHAHETLDRFKDNAMRRRQLQLRQYSGRRGDAHDWFPRPMAGTPSKAVILRSACS
jgi:hypothetical protein